MREIFVSRRLAYAVAVVAAAGASIVAGSGGVAATPGGIRAAAKPTVTVTKTVTETVTATVTKTVTETVTATVTETQAPVTVTVTVTETPGSTTTSVPTTTTTTTAPPPSGVTLEPVDGGVDWYSKFTTPPNYNASNFPIGVWFESVQAQSDVDLDKQAGLNTYVELTDNTNVSLVSTSGMNVITDNLDALGDRKNGHLLYDEADMQYGPGAGYTFMQQKVDALPKDGKVRYANYGKGVVFWESDTDAAQFVNNYQDFTSTDVYWYTDPDVCLASQGGYLLGLNRDLTASECHRAWNYGVQVDKVRRLAGYNKPIWNYVELGAPGNNGVLITKTQAAAAVWASLIHGARGIVYFNHSYSGPCQSQHILRDPCYSDMRSYITRLNDQIQRLAPVLNSPTVKGLTQVSGPVDALTKSYGGSLYVFAGAKSVGNATFTIPCVGNTTVTALDEGGRTLQAMNGSFTDSFPNLEAYHLYRIDQNCGLG